MLNISCSHQNVSETNSPVTKTFHTHLNAEGQGREEEKERSYKHFTRMHIDKIGKTISILDRVFTPAEVLNSLAAWVSRTQVRCVYKTR